MPKSCKIDLPVTEREEWPDGTKITHHKIPLPFRRKPVLPFRLPERVVAVPLDRIFASQSTVTDVGLCKRSTPGDLPIVYKERDGTFTTADGHHRIVRALLRGRKRLKMRVVDVP